MWAAEHHGRLEDLESHESEFRIAVSDCLWQAATKKAAIIGLEIVHQLLCSDLSRVLAARGCLLRSPVATLTIPSPADPSHDANVLSTSIY